MEKSGKKTDMHIAPLSHRAEIFAATPYDDIQEELSLAARESAAKEQRTQLLRNIYSGPHPFKIKRKKPRAPGMFKFEQLDLKQM